MNEAQKKAQALEKAQSLEKIMNEHCLERSDVIRGAMIALLAREHILMIGTPGCGKTMLSNLISKAIRLSKDKYFKYGGHPLTKPEEILGPLSAKGMMDDKFVRQITGYLPTAHIAFIDEAFKLSPSIRQTMLGIANEREFRNGTEILDCPLRTLFAASNELPTSPNDAAFYDRLAIRFMVYQLQDDDNAEMLFTGIPTPEVPEITEEDLAIFDQEVPQIKLSGEIAKILVEIRREVANANIFVSDRKWRQTARILQAAAYLDGKSEVEQDHFDILNAILWNTPDERPRARKIIGKHGNPLGERILALQDAFADVVKDMKRPTSDEKHIDVIEGMAKLRGTMELFKTMKKEHPNNGKVLRAFEICKTDFNKASAKHLNFS